MYYVYIIQSIPYPDQIYIGNTPFIIEKNANLLAESRVEINKRGIHNSIVVSRKFWKMLKNLFRLLSNA